MFRVNPDNLINECENLHREIQKRNEACDIIRSAANALEGMSSMGENARKFKLLASKMEERLSVLVRLYFTIRESGFIYKDTEYKVINKIEDVKQINSQIISSQNIPQIGIPNGINLIR